MSEQKCVVVPRIPCRDCNKLLHVDKDINGNTIVECMECEYQEGIESCLFNDLRDSLAEIIYSFDSNMGDKAKQLRVDKAKILIQQTKWSF